MVILSLDATAWPHPQARTLEDRQYVYSATLYYEAAQESARDLELMRRIDAQYLKTPFHGYRRMTVCLRQQGYAVNPKRIQRLMHTVMGIQAVYPKPRTTVKDAEHRIYPYLPAQFGDHAPQSSVEHRHHLHSDAARLHVSGGRHHWYSRYVLAWQLSNFLEGRFCLEALEQALLYGRPEIFNTDQGVQFTAKVFTGRLEDAGIRVSMDGRGRAVDNIFIERFWSSLKNEDIYLRDYATVPDLEARLQRYFAFYNHERPHQSLNYVVPGKVHQGLVKLVCQDQTLTCFASFVVQHVGVT